MTRWRYGCLGCLGVTGVALIVGGIGIAIGGYVLQTQWEAAVRAVVEERTGGEVTFDHLLLGLGTVTLTAPTVHGADGAVLLTADQLTVTALPWTFDAPTWALDTVTVEGLRGTLPRSNGLPARTLEALRLAEGLPRVDVGTLVVPDATVTLGTAEITWEEAEVSAISVTPGSWEIAWGSVTARGVEAGPGGAGAADSDRGPATGSGTAGAGASETHGTGAATVEHARIGTLTVTHGGWRPGQPVELSDVHLTATELRPGRSGWTLPPILLGALAEAGIPEARIVGLAFTDLDLASGPAAAHLAEAHVGSAGGSGTTVSWGEGGATDIVLTDSGRRFLGVERAILSPGTWNAGGDRLRVEGLSLDGVRADVTRGQPRLGVPAATWLLLAMDRPDWRGLELGTLEMADVGATVRSPAGDTETIHQRVVTHDVLASPDAPWWRIGGTEVSGTTLRVAGKTVATARSVSLTAAGGVTIRGAEAWTQVRADRTLDVPPIVSVHTPTWLGGSYATGPWYGVSFDGLPYQPRTVVFTDTVVHLEDTVLAEPATTWNVQIVRAQVGPMSETVALQLDARVAEGSVTATGSARRDGSAQVDVRLTDLALEALAPYLGAALKSAGLSVQGGRLDGQLTTTLAGSVVSVQGDTQARDLQVGGGVLAGAANTGVRLTSGATRTFRFRLVTQSDLADPKQHLVPRVAAATAKGLLTGGAVGQVGDAAATTTSQVAGTVLEKGASAVDSVKKVLAPKGGKRRKGEADADP